MCLVLRTFKGQLWIFDLPDNGFNYHNRKQNMESAVFVVFTGENGDVSWGNAMINSVSVNLPDMKCNQI